jgi:hypothetical protein
MKSLPKLSNLTPDNRVWRLDWFGDCGYPSTIRRFAQPSIKVTLSPLRGDAADHTGHLHPDSTDHQHPHEAWVPISTLPLLAIGDLWQNGRQIASPDYQVETFKALPIHPESTAFVKAGLALDEHFLLPLNRHPWHRLHTQAYCVSVGLSGGRRLLVPCVEIIRFYFGSSGNFIQRLFTHPLTANSLWTEKRFDSAIKHLHLVLANRLSGVSAADIGRIAISKFAWRAAAGIFASCQKAAVQRHHVYPYTGFPFEGVTNLMASGAWLPFGEQEDATFLVYRLRSCAYPFPFRSLSYEAADKKAWHSSSSDRGEQGTRFSRRDEETGEVVDTDPTNDKQKRFANFASKHRFPDLARKQVWRERIEAMGNADVFLRRVDGSMEQVAFGESDRSSEAAGVDPAENVHGDSKSSHEEPLPWFVRTGIKMIVDDPRYASSSATIKVVCPTGKTKQVFNLPMVVNDDGEIDQSLLIIRADGSTRQRRGCFVSMHNCEAHERHLLIVEGKSPREHPVVIAVVSFKLSAVCKIIADA